MKTLTALILALAALPAAAQFKCTGPDGKVSFQQTPCESAAKGERLELKKPPKSADDWPVDDSDLKDARVAAAAEKIKPGMRLVDVVKLTGRNPNKFNTVRTDGGEADQVVYYFGSRTLFVYLQNSIVTAVQLN